MARWRRVLVTTLVVLGCVLAPISVLGVWTRNTLLDTDQYVDTVGPLAEKPGVQEAVSISVARQLRSSVDLDELVADALPSRAEFLKGPLADAVERFARDAALRFVQTDRFQTLWENANRRAHTQVLAVLKGEGSETVETRHGQVVVNLEPVVDRVQASLEDLGLDVFDTDSGTRVGRQFVLFDSETLRSAQWATRLLDTLAEVLPILAVLAFAAALALSADRRRTLLRSALGLALAMGVVLTLFNLARTAYLDAVSSPNLTRGRAAGEIYDQVLSFLRLSVRSVFALAVVVAVSAWISGPGRIATRVRASIRDFGGGIEPGDRAEPAPINVFASTYRTGLRVLVVGLGLFLLVVLKAPGPMAVTAIALLVVVGLVLVEMLARGARVRAPHNR